jgi:phosphohistidine phosphatase
VVIRELILMRHAEASPAGEAAGDYERPLTANGCEAATRAARALLIEVGAPQLILCSPALRTLSSAELAQKALQLPRSVISTEAAIYLATATTLLRVVAATDDAITRLLLIAHNPGISRLLARLSSHHVDHALATAEYVCLPLPISHWSELGGR